MTELALSGFSSASTLTAGSSTRTSQGQENERNRRFANQRCFVANMRGSGSGRSARCSAIDESCVERCSTLQLTHRPMKYITSHRHQSGYTLAEWAYESLRLVALAATVAILV